MDVSPWLDNGEAISLFVWLGVGFLIQLSVCWFDGFHLLMSGISHFHFRPDAASRCLCGFFYLCITGAWSS